MAKIPNFVLIISILFGKLVQARTIYYGQNQSMLYENLWQTDVSVSVNTTLYKNYSLSSQQRMLFDTNSITLDGNGYTLDMTTTGVSLIVVSDSVSVTISNVEIKNFSSDHLSLGSGSAVVFSNCVISMMPNQTLNKTLTLRKNSIINGNGAEVTIGSSGAITSSVAAENITLKNIVFKNVSGTKISCGTSTSSIIFDNVKMVMSAATSFALGSFSVNNRLTLEGGYTFTFNPSSVCTINPSGELYLNLGANFYYNPGTANANLLAFTNSTSRLVLDNSTLSNNTQSIILKLGTLATFGSSFLTSAATNASQGFFFGDGSSSVNDLTLDISPGSKLRLTAGYLSYNNMAG